MPTPLPQQSVVTKREKSKPNRDIEDENKKMKQNLFLSQLRSQINANKTYPNSARRRGIQGEVEMRFFVTKDGDVQNIEKLSGRSIFEKSAIAAIKRSFPMKIDEALFSFPKEFRIKIAYILK